MAGLDTGINACRDRGPGHTLLCAALDSYPDHPSRFSHSPFVSPPV
jgi:hypothetical protein